MKNIEDCLLLVEQKASKENVLQAIEVIYKNSKFSQKPFFTDLDNCLIDIEFEGIDIGVKAENFNIYISKNQDNNYKEIDNIPLLDSPKRFFSYFKQEDSAYQIFNFFYKKNLSTTESLYDTCKLLFILEHITEDKKICVPTVNQRNETIFLHIQQDIVKFELESPKKKKL